MKICSPMAYGNGAFIVHQVLQKHIADYRVCGFNPYWTLLPPVLRFLSRKSSADIIHTTPDYAIFFRKENKPLVVTFHNLVLDRHMRDYSSPLQRLHYRTDLRMFTQSAIHKANIVTAVSKFTADLVQQELNCSKNIRVIYNGVDAEKFKPDSQPKSGPIKVLFSGNMTKRKGVDLLPSIAEKLNLGIVIQYTRGLRTRFSGLGSKNLSDLGVVSYTSMPDVYRQADIFLLPTVREGHSLAVLEAMASGLPVVASNCSSLPEQIDNGKGGFLCELGNADDFANRINLLADSPQLRRDMGQWNQQRAQEQFTIDKMVNDYYRLFEEVLSD